MEVADLHRLRAGMLIDRSEPDDAARAQELLHLALEDYVRFGMPSYAAVVEQMLAGMPSPAPAPRPRTGSHDQSTPHRTAAGTTPGSAGRRPG